MILPGARACVRGTLIGVCCAAVACKSTRRLERQDWGALAGSEDITVVTHGGARHELGLFDFLTTGVEGRGEWQGISIPLDSIALVEVKERNTAATAVAVLAAGTAIGVLIAYSQSPEKPEPSSSCPFVYSFDGDRYRFDSETFAGAIAPGLDRTDWDNLEHLRAVDGFYRLRLTNERPETQYTDEVSLLVVDHPPGTLVTPDAAGRIHATLDARSPLSALDASGDDVLDRVRSPDGVTWRGASPESTDLDDPEELRDGMILSFQRPESSTEARVVIRARNTSLAPFALREVLELRGEGLFAWYGQVARDAGLRERIRGWVAREGTLTVSVWENDGWVLKGAMPDVGPAIAKNQVVAFDLEASGDDRVLVKLESARGLWELDWVAMETGSAPPIHVTEAPLMRAREGVRDLSGLLGSADGRYYTTLRGAEAELEFAEPDPPAGSRARSMILRSRGFYYIYASHEGPGDAALAERILDEPLLGNRYVLSRLQSVR